MKKILKFIALIIVVFLSFNLYACKENDADDDTNTPTILSAYDQLTEDEKKIFDVLMPQLQSFYNPQEVRILAVGRRNEAGVAIQFSGTNKVGGKITKSYILYYDNHPSIDTIKKGYFKEQSDSFKVYHDNEFNLKNLNRAIIEYWEEKGLL